MNKELKKRLDEKLLSVIKEYKPIDNRLLDAEKLMPTYKSKLEEYTKEILGEIDNEFVNDMMAELRSNIIPAVKMSTGGTDEVLTDIVCIELAKVIYQHEVGKSDEKNDISKVDEYLRRGTLFFLKGAEDDNTRPIETFNKKMEKHIYRAKYNKASQKSGCTILLVPFLGSLIFFFTKVLSQI